jgi:hypothetical protein
VFGDIALNRDDARFEHTTDRPVDPKKGSVRRDSDGGSRGSERRPQSEGLFSIAS